MPSLDDSDYTGTADFLQGNRYVLPEFPFVAPAELHSGQPAHHPIVIAGGGIAGLTLACGLARLGVPAVLLDEDTRLGATDIASRGVVYTQKSLEIFQRLGIYERIAAKGAQWSVGRTFAGTDEVYAFDMRHQSGFNLSSQPAFINLQQFYVESFLVDRIQELGGVELRWGHRVSGFRQDGPGALLTVSTPAGDYEMRADWVVDATGANSPFRQWAGASVTGNQGDDLWCIADVRFGRQRPPERHTWIEAPFNDNRAVWQHLLADGVWRIDYQMAPGTGAVSDDAVRERLARQFGPEAQVEVVSVGSYASRTEVVNQMRQGPVFFMGDAAKVVSPFGARGGNSAIADADNLAWKLAAVLHGVAPPALLDSYHAERHEAARHTVRVTQRTNRFLRPAGGVERSFRDAAIGLARQYPFARQLVNTGRMAGASTYTESPVCALGGGQSAQNATFRWADDSPGMLNDLLLWAAGGLLLLVFGDISPAARERLRALTRHAPVRAVQVVGDGRPHALEHVVDPKGHLQGACHVFGHAWALLRPDAYVAATGESIDAALVDAVGNALGLRQGEQA